MLAIRAHPRLLSAICTCRSLVGQPSGPRLSNFNFPLESSDSTLSLLPCECASCSLLVSFSHSRKDSLFDSYMCTHASTSESDGSVRSLIESPTSLFLMASKRSALSGTDNLLGAVSSLCGFYHALHLMRADCEQLLSADRKLFQVLSDKTRAGVQATPQGRPVEACFKDVSESTEVLTILQPLPKSAGGPVRTDPSSARSDPYPPPQVRRQRPKGKGKGGGKARVRLPTQLIGCRAHTNAGDPICFGYGLKTCKEIVKNGRCPRGFTSAQFLSVESTTRRSIVRAGMRRRAESTARLAHGKVLTRLACRPPCEGKWTPIRNFLKRCKTHLPCNFLLFGSSRLHRLPKPLLIHRARPLNP